MNEIQNAVEKAKFREEALQAIKRRHHHDDGTEVMLTPAEDGQGIERKVIEDENKWKMQTQQQRTAADIFISNSSSEKMKQPKLQQQQSSDAQPIKKQQKEIMASCSCGKLFEATPGDAASGMQIKTFDAAGNATGSGSEGYNASGQQGESYSVQGSTGKDYAGKNG